MGRLLLGLLLILGVTGCSGEPGRFPSAGSGPEPAATTEPAATKPAGPERKPSTLIAYVPGDPAVEQTANRLAEVLGSDVYRIESGTAVEVSAYAVVLLGFAAEESGLSQELQDFLRENDLGARTIYPFVTGEEIDPAGIFAAISQLQPGALLGESLLALPADTEEITRWAQTVTGEGASVTGPGNTVATATVTPAQQQVLYLWELGNAPAQTEYTVNHGGYFDEPDFRPYITSYPVPEGMEPKGAVLICPGGAFQFRSDQPEGVEVAEALSALGYQSFVVDYRLRPYTQQEGALDLARAVRFVRAHAREYGIDEADIAVMGFSAGGILSGEMLLHFAGNTLPTALDPDYQPDALDALSADAAACGMIYAFYGRLSVGTTDVELLRAGNLPPTFYCYGTREPFYGQFLANAAAAEKAGVPVERLQLDGMPHGFGAGGGWISTYDQWLSGIFGGQ